MNSSLAWQSDSYGTLLLHLSADEQGGYAYIQARRPYCDRGHWEWGNLGIDANHRQAPSYYFMRQAVAQAEVEAWLGRLTGQSYTGPRLADLPNAGEGPFSQPNGKEQGWAWGLGALPRSLEVHAKDPESGAQVSLVLTESEGDTGPLWTLTQQGLPNIDDADRFPRVYLDLTHARQEVEDFLAWRLLKVACELPYPLEEGIRRPLPAELAQRLETWGQAPSPEARPRRARGPK